MKKVKRVIHKHSNYVYKIPRGKCKRPKQVKPRLSLSLKEVLEKFTRGLPLDMEIRDEVYLTNKEGVDYERLSKLDFDDKAALAAEKKAFGNKYVDDLKEAGEALAEQADEERRQREDQNADRDRREPASDALDNTLADDTRASDRGGQSNRNTRKGGKYGKV